MLLLKDDVQRIVNLGFKEDFFAVNVRGFNVLRNSNGRCVFHDGAQCTIYPNRPLGCRLYPVIFDENLNRPVKDGLCPFRAEFPLQFKAKEESARLYLKLLDERQTNDEKKNESRTCLRCNTLNSADSKFCNKCGLPIDNATVMQMDTARARMDELLNKLTENPEKLEKLL